MTGVVRVGDQFDSVNAVDKRVTVAGLLEVDGRQESAVVTWTVWRRRAGLWYREPRSRTIKIQRLLSRNYRRVREQ